MPAKASKTSGKGSVKAVKEGSRSDPEVAAYLRDLEHPMGKDIEAIRKIMLGISPEVREGIKWNSPSFRKDDWFATVNVLGAGRPPRAGDPPSLRLILHAGAKVKASSKRGLKIEDPTGMLKWLAKDRCMVVFDVQTPLNVARRKALSAIMSQWVAAV